MKIKIQTWTPMFLLALTSLFISTSVLAADNNKKAIMNSEMQFYTALNQLFTGDLDQMKDVWSHADDVTYMGPGGGFKVGWNQVLKDWEAQAALKLGGKVQPADIQITAGQDIAVVSNYENGENRNAKGDIQKISIRATNIFRKESGKWKMIGHHTDLLPYLTK